MRAPGRNARRARPGGAALVLAALAIVLAGCGTAEPRPAPAPPALVTETAGRGVQQSTIVRPGGRAGPLPVVVFLHGWGAPDPGFYRPWLEHLARRGNAVVYPRYQDSFVAPPRQALGNVLAAVRIALARPGLRADGLVVAGHSAGGALAADYAALARTAGLPVPAAVFAVYPGRRLPRVPRGLPEIPPRLIGAGTGSRRWPAAPTGSWARRPPARSSAARGAPMRGSCSSAIPPSATTRRRCARTLPPGARSGRRWTS